MFQSQKVAGVERAVSHVGLLLAQLEELSQSFFIGFTPYVSTDSEFVVVFFKRVHSLYLHSGYSSKYVIVLKEFKIEFVWVHSQISMAQELRLEVSTLQGQD